MADRPSSPTDACPICLQEIADRARIPNCLHSFCLPCIRQWLQKKPNCPLCKGETSAILHNFRTPDKYDVLQVTPETKPPSHVFEQQRYAARLQRPSHWSWSSRSSNQREQLSASSSSSNPTYLSSPVDQRNFRRAVYTRNLRAIPMDHFSVNIAPEFLRTHPDALRRIHPFLERELQMLLGIGDVSILTAHILQLMTRHPLSSAEMRAKVYPVFSENTDTFIHELSNFAKSPFDMRGYDRLVRYEESTQGRSSDTRQRQRQMPHTSELYRFMAINALSSSDVPEPIASQIRRADTNQQRARLREFYESIQPDYVQSTTTATTTLRRFPQEWTNRETHTENHTNTQPNPTSVESQRTRRESAQSEFIIIESDSDSNSSSASIEIIQPVRQSPFNRSNQPVRHQSNQEITEPPQIESNATEIMQNDEKQVRSSLPQIALERNHIAECKSVIDAVEEKQDSVGNEVETKSVTSSLSRDGFSRCDEESKSKSKDSDRRYKSREGKERRRHKERHSRSREKERRRNGDDVDDDDDGQVSTDSKRQRLLELDELLKKEKEKLERMLKKAH